MGADPTLCQVEPLTDLSTVPFAPHAHTLWSLTADTEYKEFVVPEVSSVQVWADRKFEQIKNDTVKINIFFIYEPPYYEKLII